MFGLLRDVRPAAGCSACCGMFGLLRSVRSSPGNHAGRVRPIWWRVHLAVRSGLAALAWRYAPSMADRTTSGTAIAVPRASVMAVIADFAAYPEWATGV